MTDILGVTSSGLRKVRDSEELKQILEKEGRAPGVTLHMRPLNNSAAISLRRFLNYEFNSNIFIPVDSFSFTFAAPDDTRPPTRLIKSGDLVQLRANEVDLSTGIIDQVEVQTMADESEQVRITGRDLIGQLEDNSAIDITDAPIFHDTYSITNVARELFQNTRINTNITLQDTSDLQALFATEPGESKLSAFQRFLDPLNLIMYLNGRGKMVVGKPNFKSEIQGRFFCDKENRASNILDIRATRADTLIPNIIVPIWSGQELVVNRVGPEQRLLNSFAGPTRIRNYGHKVIKSIVVSNPDATTAQGASDVTILQRAGGQNVLQAYAKRELARQNINTLIVQIRVQGHLNSRALPYRVDTCYQIKYDRAEVDEKMYLYDVTYSLSEEEGQITTLNFCPLNTIVPDSPIFSQGES